MSEEFTKALPLVSKGYSLEADMLTGWRPLNIKDPYPLFFDSDYEYLKLNPCVYEGYKPDDSFGIHNIYSDGTDHTYSFDSSQPSMATYLLKKGKNEPKLPQTHQNTFEDSLIFDSKFECGNLDRVEMVNKDEYDLFMRIDTNTSGQMHWFYFSVSGIKSKRVIKFNIVNFTRTTNLFNAGMKPRVFSIQEIRNKVSTDWKLGGDNISFSPSKLNKYNLKKPLYQLSFTYTFQYPNDKVWFATTIPYTYCRLQKIFRLLKSEKNSYITTSTLCKSLSLIDIPLITITNPNVPNENKKYIIAIARVHPAETVGSWVMEGFLRFIASKHPEAASLRNKFIFKIVPMVNPDGVIVGNSRTSMSGNDLNRTYINPSEERHPEIVAIKKLVEDLQGRSFNKVFSFIDLHGHFSKKGSFIYGPYFPIHNSMYYKSKIIPRLISERTDMFRFYSCKFRISKLKKSAARAVMSSEFQINHCYTLETSYYAYINQNRETHPFSPESLFILGEKLARSINEYVNMLEINRSKQILKKKKGKLLIKDPVEVAFIEDFDFEIPHLSFVSTTKHNKSPTDCFSNLMFKHETHTKRNLEEWVNILKNENPQFPSSSSDSGTDGEDIYKQSSSLPPIDLSKKTIKKFNSKKFETTEVTSPTLQIVQEVPVPKHIVQEIKKIHDYNKMRYAESLIKTQITPKKLLEVRNRSTNPYISTQPREGKKDAIIRDFLRPGSLKPFSARNDEREKVDRIFSNLV